VILRLLRAVTTTGRKTEEHVMTTKSVESGPTILQLPGGGLHEYSREDYGSEEAHHCAMS